MFSPVSPGQYDAVYRRQGQLAWLRRFDRALLDEKVAQLDCDGFLTCDDLGRYRRLFQANWPQSSSGADTLLDLGCGTGGLGTWLAQELGVGLVGIDFSAVAIGHTEEQASRRKWGTHFVVAEFAALAIRRGRIGGVLSLDALYLAVDPAAALRDLYTVVVPGALLVFTILVRAGSACEGRVPAVASWISALRTEGFILRQQRDLTEVWRAHMWEKHTRRWENRAQLREQLGDWVERELAVSAEMLGVSGKPSVIASVRRYEIAAEAKTSEMKQGSSHYPVT